MKAIILSALIVNGVVGTGLFVWRQKVAQRTNDPAWQISHIVQQGNQPLPSGFLSHALRLPMAFDSLHVKRAEEQLKSWPIFDSVRVRKKAPGAVIVDYTLRKPIAAVGQFSNAAFDAEGIVFPLQPFYTPKRLPKVFFVGDQPTPREMEMTLAIKEALNDLEPSPRLISIDLQAMSHPNPACREIVVMVMDERIQAAHIIEQPILLRLPSEGTEEALLRLEQLRAVIQKRAGDAQTSLKAAGVTVDLRLPSSAYLSTFSASSIVK